MLKSLGFPFAVVVCSLLGLAPTAAAQSLISRADSAREDARFDEAERLYTEAEAADSGLDREDLVDLYRHRALVRAARRNRSGAREDLARLFALDPDAEFGREAPPSLRREIRRARAAAVGPIEVEVTASGEDEGVRIETEVTNDPAELVRSVRVVELLGGGIERHAGRSVVIPTDGELRYLVEVVGPGGALLESVGSPARPRVFRGAASSADGDEVASRGDDSDSGDDGGDGGGGGGGDDSGVIVAIAVLAGVVLVGAAVALGIYFSPSGRTQPGGPVEVMP